MGEFINIKDRANTFQTIGEVLAVLVPEIKQRMEEYHSGVDHE